MGMNTPDSLTSSAFYEVYAGAVADKNLVAIGGNLCRSIRAKTAGDIVVTRPDGVNVTLPFEAGETQLVQAKALVAGGSTATGITVLW